MSDVAGYQTPVERAMAARARPFARLAVQHASQSPDMLDLTGDADWPLPESVGDAVVTALEAGETHYTARTGIEPLRQALATRSTSEGFPATPETCVVTNGGSEALFIGLQALVSPGDRVILVEPVHPHLAELVTFIGGEAEYAEGLPLSGARDATAIVVPAASRIDGRVVPNDQLVDLLESVAGSGATVILDRSTVPDQYLPPHPFPRPDLTAGAVTVGSFSGLFGLSGWRAGYFTAPEDLMPRLAGLKESMSISTTTPTQFAMLAALEHAESILATAREQARARRDAVCEAAASRDLSFQVPDAFPGLLLDVRHAGMPDVEVVRRLEERGVRVQAGSLYGASLSGFIRADLRIEETTLLGGIERIADFLMEVRA